MLSTGIEPSSGCQVLQKASFWPKMRLSVVLEVLVQPQSTRFDPCHHLFQLGWILSAWYCMVLLCSIWYCMVLYGVACRIAWYCIVLYCIDWYFVVSVIVWCCMLLRGIAYNLFYLFSSVCICFLSVLFVFISFKRVICFQLSRQESDSSIGDIVTH